MGHPEKVNSVGWQKHPQCLLCSYLMVGVEQGVRRDTIRCCLSMRCAVCVATAEANHAKPTTRHWVARCQPTTLLDRKLPDGTLWMALARGLLHPPKPEEQPGKPIVSSHITRSFKRIRMIRCTAQNAQAQNALGSYQYGQRSFRCPAQMNRLTAHRDSLGNCMYSGARTIQTNDSFFSWRDIRGVPTVAKTC